MPDLNNAIELIRQGRKEEGQRILEAIIKAEPGNISAWFWYVETCPTVERRIQVLETCLKMNPGNPQAAQGLQALKSIQSAQVSSTPPAAPPKPAAAQLPQQTSSYSTHNESPQESYFNDPPPSSDPYKYEEEAPKKSAGDLKKPWEQDADSYVDNSMLSKPKPPARSYSFYDAWMTVIFNQDIESYADVLKDPEAGLERAFVWMACAGIANALVIPISLMLNPQLAELMAMPEFQDLSGGLGLTAIAGFFTLIMLFALPIINMINLAINGAIQNFLAVMFGGNGYYSRTVYALAVYLAPLTIVSSVLYLVPVIGQCLGSLLGFYGIYLNIRALRAAHSISTGSAFGVLIAPGILLVIFACLFAYFIGSMVGSTIPAGSY